MGWNGFLGRVWVKSACRKSWEPALEAWEGVGLWCGGEQGGVGVGGRKWDLAFWQQQQWDVISWMLNATRVSASSVGSFLLHHMKSPCGPAGSELDQLADEAENQSCHWVLPKDGETWAWQAGSSRSGCGFAAVGGLGAKASVLLPLGEEDVGCTQAVTCGQKREKCWSSALSHF